MRISDWSSDVCSSDLDTPLVAFGHRSATWEREPTVAELDEISTSVPIVLISGDAHHAWMNSVALRSLGLAERDDVVREAAWFAASADLEAVVGQEATPEAYRRAQAEAATKENGRGAGGGRVWQYG